MLTPGLRVLAMLAAVLLAAGVTSGMTSVATPFPGDTITLFPSSTPDPGTSACACSPCLHNGTCRDTEDWECSGDPGLGHFSCVCPVGFTGTRCEVKLNTTACRSDGDACQANGTCLCRSDNECNCMPDFPHSPPNCINKTVSVNFDLTAWSPQPMICFDMYYTNASSHCYDPDDTLVFSVTSEQTIDLFCLTVNYDRWQTCLQVNNTFRTKRQSVKSSERVTLNATEFKENGRSDTLHVEVFFNSAPAASKTLNTYVLNSADLLAAPLTLNILQDAGINDPDGHNMTFSIVDSSNVPSQLNLTIDTVKGILQARTTRSSHAEFLSNVTVMVADDGTPSLNTSLIVELRLLYLDCYRPSKLYLDYRRLPASEPGPLVFRQNCIATPGYSTSLNVTISSQNISAFLANGSLHVYNGGVGVYNISLAVSLDGHIRQSWFSDLYIGFFKTITYVVARPLWNEKLADLFSNDFRNVSNMISNEVMSNLTGLGAAYYDVVQFRNGSGLMVDGLLYALNNTTLQRTADILYQLLHHGSSSTFAVINSTVRIYDQVGFLDVRELTPEADRPVNNTNFTVTCHVEAMTLGDDVIIEWTLNGFLLRPMRTSRFQIETLSSGPTTYLSILRASPVFYRDRGNVTCKAKTVTTGVVQTRNMEFHVMTQPKVKLEPAGTSYVRYGQKLTVTCSVTTYPNPNYIQLHDDQGKILTKDETNATMLTYEFTAIAAETVVTCTANNTVGQSEVDSITVIMFSRPEASTVTSCPSNNDSRGVLWEEVPVTATASKPCPSGSTGMGMRRCLENGSFAVADYSQCVRIQFRELETQVQHLKDGLVVTSVLDVCRNMTSLTDPTTPQVTAAELDTVMSLMSRLADLGRDFQLSRDTATNTTHEFMKIATHVMSSKNKDEWSLLREKSNKTALGVMSAVVSMSEVLAQSLRNSSINISEGFLALLVGNEHIHTIGNISFPDTDHDNVSSLFILRDTIESLPSPENDQVKYSALRYRDVENLLPNGTSSSVSNGSSRSINSDILVMNLYSHPNASASPLITLTFLHKNTSFIDPVCGFWNTTTLLWDNTGCRVSKKMEGRTECQCDHLTNFALLMSPAATSDHLILIVITYVGVGISLLCLVLTLAFYAAVWRYVRSDRASVLVNLCVALTLAYVTFLAGVARTDNRAACTAVAVLLHYFFLAAFFLMLAEGLEVLVTMVTVFSTKAKRGKLLAVGWGVPLLIVAISMAATQLKGYGDEKSCWLSLGNGLFWAFVVPALFVIAANSCIIIKIIHTMLHTRSMVSKPLQIKARAALRSLCVLVPVLGVTWISGIMAVNEETVAFQYIFTVCNSLQGLFIFIFHCALNNKVREGLGHSVRKFRSRHSMHTSHRSSKSPHLNGDQSTPPRRDSGGSPYLMKPGTSPLTTGFEGPPFRTIGTNGSNGSNHSSDREVLNPRMFRPATRRQDELPARHSPLSGRSVAFQPENGERKHRRYKPRNSPPSPRTGQAGRGAYADHTRFPDSPATFSNAAFEEDEAPYMQRVAQRIFSPDFEPALVFGSRGSDLHKTGNDGAHGVNSAFGDSHRKYIRTTVVIGNPASSSEHQRFQRNTADAHYQTRDQSSGFHTRAAHSLHSILDSRGRWDENAVGNNHRRDGDDVGNDVTSIKLPRVTLR